MLAVCTTRSLGEAHQTYGHVDIHTQPAASTRTAPKQQGQNTSTCIHTDIYIYIYNATVDLARRKDSYIYTTKPIRVMAPYGSCSYGPMGPKWAHEGPLYVHMAHLYHKPVKAQMGP